MKYISTRGETAPVSFTDAGLMGLAPDGGLLVPESLPDLSGELERLSALSYADLALELYRHFCDDIPDAELQELVRVSTSAFRHPEIAPLHPLGDRYILELFHGPTLAFKDMAMQFLAPFFSWALEQRDEELNILGSTSGDTGSAAIHGVAGKARLRIFMMHPEGKTSPLQALQMTSVLEGNVVNMAVEGTFDDCQRMMKSCFADLPFKQTYKLGAVNSVNWVRVMAQIAYYMYSGLQLMKETGATALQFAVPTGNFGNILAGYYASCMGLPVSRFILATNENDILSRLFNTGIYSRGDVAQTLSPSMDIQVASNFERFLFELMGRDDSRVRTAMAQFVQEGTLDLSAELQNPVMQLFRAGSADTEDTLRVIRREKEAHDYVLDPHTAVGVEVGDALRNSDPLICLATAHPAKFPAAIEAAIGEAVTHPVLEALKDKETRCLRMANDEAELRQLLEDRLPGG